MLFRRRSQWTAPGAMMLALLVVLTVACGGRSPTDPTMPGDGGISLPGASALVLDGTISTDDRRHRVERVVREALAAARAEIPLDRVTVIVRFGLSLVIPGFGVGGRADAGTVRLTFDPDHPSWETTLETDTFEILLHEFHHVARIREVGFAGSLLDAMVLEGLADHFMIEVSGADAPPWAMALTSAEIETWLARARGEWRDPGYDHDVWFFGTAEIPNWTGYTLGFEITGRYLRDNPSRRASTLFAEPATTFEPSE